MFARSTYIPDGVPVLSRGRHRNPRKGACFMEMASFLAGEKWSDHPSCTHPLLATIARCVNDLVDDGSRQQLTPLIAEVVGLNPTDDRVAPALIILCTQAAVPIAAQERQNVLAISLMSAERAFNGPATGPLALSPRSRQTLDTVPAAERWAREFMDRSGTTNQPLQTKAAPRIAALAVESIARACVSDSDARLVALLRACIDQTKRYAAQPAADAAPAPARATFTRTDLDQRVDAGVR